MIVMHEGWYVRNIKVHIQWRCLFDNCPGNHPSLTQIKVEGRRGGLDLEAGTLFSKLALRGFFLLELFFPLKQEIDFCSEAWIPTLPFFGVRYPSEPNRQQTCFVLHTNTIR
jgi:hypothetical protein